LAGPLLWVALTAGSGSGCFWPQDDQLFPTLPPPKNRPPRIILSLVKPPSIDTSYKPGCDLPFSFSVEDPDVSDVIRSRWFVYSSGAPRGLAFVGPTALGGTTVQRGQTFTAPIELKGPSSELIQNGEHRLEAVIADGEFEGNSTETRQREPLAMPDGGTVTDVSYIDTYVWIVKTSDTILSCGGQ
jgi:hypothetical protein